MFARRPRWPDPFRSPFYLPSKHRPPGFLERVRGHGTVVSTESTLPGIVLHWPAANRQLAGAMSVAVGQKSPMLNGNEYGTLGVDRHASVVLGALPHIIEACQHSFYTFARDAFELPQNIN